MSAAAPLIFDAHLDLAWNALDWNRDLLLPVTDIRRRELGLFPSPLRGGARGGGRRYGAMNVLKHAIRYSATHRYSVAQHAIALRLTKTGAHRIVVRSSWTAAACHCTTPTPNPSPQGGGERAMSASSAKPQTNAL